MNIGTVWMIVLELSRKLLLTGLVVVFGKESGIQLVSIYQLSNSQLLLFDLLMNDMCMRVWV
jgi:hypothetical protein